MHPFGPRNAHNLPMNVLFPEAYAASKRMITRDFVVIGAWIVGFVVALAWIAG
jgi:hypothetical protein